MSDPRLCIATLDPTIGGGVPSMARFAYQAAERAGFDPFLAANRIARESDVRIQDLPRLDWSRSIDRTTHDGLETWFVPRYLPEFEFLQYVTNGGEWSTIIEEADAYFGVGGNIQCCHPFARHGVRFGCWVATTVWDDRKDRVKRAPLSWQVRDYLSKPVLQGIERSVYGAADQVLVLSEYTRERVVSEQLLSEKEITVVPYPVDTTLFSPDGDEKSTDGPTVLFVGRFTDPRKNVEMLVRAFASVREHHPNAELRLVGDDPTPGLRDTVEEYGLAEAVTFEAYVPNGELPPHYRSADVFAIPSRQEGLGIVGLEAMACGTPVVATRCGGPEQYVEDGETGLLVANDDEAGMADALTALLRDDTRRGELGSNAAAYVQNNCAEPVLSERFVHVYERLV